MEIPQISNMPDIERSEAQMNVAMQSQEHLLSWLEGTNRKWLVFNGLELAKALPFPDGIKAFVQVVQCYRDHRAGIESGRFETQADPVSGGEVRVPLMKSEMLELAELDRAIRYLITQAATLDPNWRLDNSPL